MGSHPVNLALRFILELCALAAIGMWGWKTGDGIWKYVLTIILVIGAAIIWGVFNVPGDPSRSGSAPVVVPGMLRLALELGIFTAAILALYDSGYQKAGLIMLILVVGHYSLSWDRIAWLMAR